MYKKNSSNSQCQVKTFCQEKTANPIINSPDSISHYKQAGNSFDIDTGQILKNLHQIDTNAFQHSNEIVKHIIANSTEEKWFSYFDLLHTRFSWVHTHSINVAVLSVMIAAESGCHKQALECIALGGLLHDAGKLLIPTSIIQKKSSLDEGQMALIKKHCELGMSLMADCGLSDDCVAIILQHHERLNGSGYPFGLKSDNIHPYAKITMIADVLDAITSYRPYRPAKSAAEAIQIIKDEGPKFSADYVCVIERLLCARSA